MYYPSSENKGTDQLRSYCEADLRLCFRIGNNPVFSRCGSINPWHNYTLSYSGDTPDPYLILVIRTAPEGRKTTTVKDNEINPVWNENFTFLLDEQLGNIMGRYCFMSYCYIGHVYLIITCN